MTAQTCIHVDLTVNEARALVNAAALLGAVVDSDGRDCTCDLPEGHTVLPLTSAQMKLEGAMVAEGAKP